MVSRRVNGFTCGAFGIGLCEREYSLAHIIIKRIKITPFWKLIYPYKIFTFRYFLYGSKLTLVSAHTACSIVDKFTRFISE